MPILSKIYKTNEKNASIKLLLCSMKTIDYFRYNKAAID